MRALGWAALIVVTVAAVATWAFLQRERAPLPAGLEGTLVFVSDRSGADALYLRRLPGGEDQRLTSQGEPAREPAFSHDGRRVAFSMRGRIGLVAVATGEVRFVSDGADWKDSSPSWRSDDGALLVSARRADSSNGDVQLLTLEPEGGSAARLSLTDTPGLDETTPVFAPLDAFVVFVREDNLIRLDPRDGRTRRLTGGFKKFRSPRFLPSGRLLCLWTEGKLYGIDVMDFDGRNRETLSQGPVYYRTVAPSPDGRFLAATFTFDLGFHPLDALKLRQTEEVRLLDARGIPVGTLARSWRHSSHSPDWGGGVRARTP